MKSKLIYGVLSSILNMRTAYAARTAAEDPLQQFKFRVTVPGLPSGLGFKSCTGLNFETEVVEYDEGAWDYTHKLPGRGKVGEVTLERGCYADTAFKDLVISTLTSSNFRGTVIIEHINRFGEVARTYKLAEAWVSKWENSDLDASSSDVAIEKLVLQFEHFLD